MCDRLDGHVVDGKCSITTGDIKFSPATATGMKAVAPEIWQYIPWEDIGSIIEINGKPVGYIIAREEEEIVYMHSVELVPEFRGAGIGEIAIKEYLSREEQRPSKLFLWLPQEKHEQFWRKVGNIQEKREKEWVIDLPPMDTDTIERQFSSVLLKNVAPRPDRVHLK